MLEEQQKERETYEVRARSDGAQNRTEKRDDLGKGRSRVEERVSQCSER